MRKIKKGEESRKLGLCTISLHRRMFAKAPIERGTQDKVKRVCTGYMDDIVQGIIVTYLEEETAVIGWFRLII